MFVSRQYTEEITPLLVGCLKKKSQPKELTKTQQRIMKAGSLAKKGEKFFAMVDESNKILEEEKVALKEQQKRLAEQINILTKELEKMEKKK